MLVALCCIWGVTWPIMKIALNEMPPLSMRTASAGLGATTLALLCLVMRRSFRLPSRKALVHVVVASLLNIVAFSLFSAFAQRIAATNRVAILAYTLPIWSVLLSWPILGERPNRIQALALLLCAAGLAILIYPLAANGIPLGIMLALAIGVCWAAGTVYLKWAQIKADPMGVSSWQMTIAFIVIATTTALADGRLDYGAAHLDGVSAVVWTGVFGNGLAYPLWFLAMRRLPAIAASLSVLSVPVIGIVSSLAILGEVPTVPDIVGFALILSASGCVLLTRQSVRA